ncbi:hypothetical protein EPN18_03085 [bacterium]|nr:MAG: hypothetical protein EPN18_03085 [bacterium]
MTRTGKIIGLFLLILFTMQVTDLTCVGDDLSLNTFECCENQLIKADSGKGKTAYSLAGILDQCQCPCHLSFTQTKSVEVISCQSIVVASFFAGDQTLKKISADIFQPPKVLI